MIELGVAGGPRREVRNYESLILNQVLATATGSVASDAAGLAAVETAAGLWARAFAGAVVEPQTRATRAVTPAVLASIARRLVRRGEAVYLIDVVNGRVALYEASWWDVRGGVRRPWTYQVTLTGPSTTETRWVSSDQVIHAMYAHSELQPWRGLGPLQWAIATGRLSIELEKALADESAGPRGNLVTVPEGHGGDAPEGETDPLASLRSDLAKLRGGLALLETTAGGFGDKGGRPDRDWKPERLGANPPMSLAEIRAGVERAVLSACGIPPSLAVDADGTAQRESFRRFLHATIQPVGELIAAELSAKLEEDIRLDFSRLFAADVQGRARAWRSLVGTEGKMDPDKAARLAGLE